VAKSWKKLAGFGEKLGRFGSLLGVFRGFLRGDFQECARTQIAWLAYFNTDKTHRRTVEDREKRRKGNCSLRKFRRFQEKISGRDSQGLFG